jgi:hypothetical protein
MKYTMNIPFKMDKSMVSRALVHPHLQAVDSVLHALKLRNDISGHSLQVTHNVGILG